jgi:hypothetical protein
MYEAHAWDMHGKNPILYPSRAEIEKYGLEPQGKSWEAKGCRRHYMKWEVFLDTEYCPLCQKIVNLEKVGYMEDYGFKNSYRCSVCLMKLCPEIGSKFARMYPKNIATDGYDLNPQSKDWSLRMSSEDKAADSIKSADDIKVKADLLVSLEKQKRDLNSFYEHPYDHIYRPVESSPVHNLISYDAEKVEYTCVLDGANSSSLEWLEGHCRFVEPDKHRKFILEILEDSKKKIDANAIPEEEMIDAYRHSGYLLDPVRVVGNIKTAEDVDYGTEPQPDYIRNAQMLKEDTIEPYQLPPEFGSLRFIPPLDWKMREGRIVEAETDNQKWIEIRPSH